MLSDEERKAIKILKINPEIIADLDEEMFEKMCEFKEKSIKELKYWASQTALNLIEKQSKEIEELTNEVMEKELIIDGMKEDRRIAVEEIQEQYFVSKEEAEQKEKKAYIDGTNIADELCNKKWKDKIKAKIEEEDKLFFKTKDVRHANRYKAYKELIKEE